MERKIGKVFDAEVTGMNDSGLYVELKEVFIEGFLPYAFDMKLKLGDKIRVVVTRLDVFRGEIVFGLKS